jgi:hypothetical protein
MFFSFLQQTVFSSSVAPTVVDQQGNALPLPATEVFQISPRPTFSDAYILQLNYLIPLNLYVWNLYDVSVKSLTLKVGYVFCLLNYLLD